MKTTTKTVKKRVKTAPKAKSKEYINNEYFDNDELESRIRQKAWEIYLHRISSGREGSELEDWLRAEELVIENI